MEKIVSLQNAKVKTWASLHQKKYRDRLGLFLAEGEHLIGEAMQAGVLEALIFDEPCPFDCPQMYEVTPQIMNRLSANVSDVHMIGVCRILQSAPQNMKRVVLLDGVQDPGNLGTIVRTARSFSFDAVYCSPQCADLYNEKAVRSTQGALFHIPVIRCELPSLIRELQKDGFTAVGTSLQESLPLKKLPEQEKMAFVFGSEGQGVSAGVLDQCDANVRIEMDGFESLNVAVAAGIIMYQFQVK
ncbi:MAG: RNA methyltransferase [Solobacterium sp.]|nr:RNA methyltransferase [Solobacterium sp.]